MTAPGRDLPAETGLSGNVVLRFGGVSRGKSGGTTGCGGGLTLGLGELGLEDGAEFLPLSETREDEVKEGVVGEGDGDRDGNECLLVGVEGRDSDRLGGGADGECKFAGM